MRDPSPRTLETEPRPTTFTIAFGRRPKLIGLVRRFVEEIYGNLYDELVAPLAQGKPWASQVSLAAHELVENAIRHGYEGDATFSLTVEMDPDTPEPAHLVRLTTRNRASPAQCESVRERLRELEQAHDLFALYVDLMTRSVSPGEGTGLGLARIRVEAKMGLSCAVEGEVLEVTALARVGGSSR